MLRRIAFVLAIGGLVGCGTTTVTDGGEPCIAGEMLVAPCGQCGQATRQCVDGRFGDFGPCLSPPSCSTGGGGGGTGGGSAGGVGGGGGGADAGDGPCTDGVTESRGCGNCGQQSRSCKTSVWGAWSACAGEGECMAGAVDSMPCGSAVGACHPGTEERDCSPSCHWGAFAACGGASYVGPKAETCGNGIDDDCNGSTDEGCNCAPAAPGDGGSFALSGTIVKLVADPQRCFLYALNTGSPSQLVVIDEAAKQELTRVNFSSTATDFDISPDGGWLVAALDSTHQLAVVDPTTWNVTTHSVASDPYAVEVDDTGRVFYETLDQFTDLRRVDLAPGGQGEMVLASFSLYEPDIELSASGFLFAGESGLTGCTLHKYNVSGGTLTQVGTSNWGSFNYGFEFPPRHVYLSPQGSDLYYAGFQLDGNQPEFARGDLGEKVFVEDSAESFAVGEQHVFDAKTLSPIATTNSQLSAAALAAADHELWTYSASTGKVSYQNTADVLAGATLGQRVRGPLPISQYALTHLVASPKRGRLYGIDSTRGVVVIIDGATLAPVSEIVVGTSPSSLAIDLTGDTLYVGHLTTMGFARIDLATETFTGFVVTDALPYGLVAVSNNRVVTIDQDQWTTARLRDATTGVTQGNATTMLYEGALTTDATGSVLFVGESGLSGSNIHRFTVGAGLTQTSVSTYDMGYGFPYPAYGAVALPDGSGVYYAGWKLDGTNLATLDYQQADTIVAVTPDSRLALSSGHAYHAADGGTAASIAGSNVMAVSPDGGTLYVWTGSAVSTVDLSAIP